MITHTHAALWKTINYIASTKYNSCSCLAKQCGLDANVFNHSKRKSKYGQPRWPSTKTIAKILISTNITFIEFAQIFDSFCRQSDCKIRHTKAHKPTQC